jgi:hypothetical protein
MRFIRSEGTTRPFVEAGLGVRLLSGPTISRTCTLSSALQFADMVGVGAQFGSHQQNQAGFRFQHLSNASIKDAEPGINFSQLYLQYNFGDQETTHDTIDHCAQRYRGGRLMSQKSRNRGTAPSTEVSRFVHPLWQPADAPHAPAS